MPELPLDHPEPFAATLGVMLFPGLDKADRRYAKAFTSQYLAEPIRRFHDSGGSLSYDDLLEIATHAGEPLSGLDKRWWGGTATGHMLLAFFILSMNQPALASWENAAKIAEATAAKAKTKGSRSALWKDRSQFHSVAHLWAAWCLREGKFSPQPEVGYDGVDDFQSFLAEAEYLRNWGQSWRATRSKAEPPLPKDVWQVPAGWQPPERQAGWPQTGGIPDLKLAEALLEGLRPAGRPLGTTKK